MGTVRPLGNRRRRDALGAARIPRKGARLRRDDPRAASAPAGSDALFFMPDLTGERLGAHRNARAQFFGLARRIGSRNCIARLSRRSLRGGAPPAHHGACRRPQLERIIASAAGRRTESWLKIKASVYGAPIVAAKEPDAAWSCAAMAATATGRFPSLDDAIAAYVRYVDEVAYRSAWAETYATMQPVFDKLYFPLPSALRRSRRAGRIPARRERRDLSKVASSRQYRSSRGAKRRGDPKSGDAAIFTAFGSIATLYGFAPLAMTSVAERAKACLGHGGLRWSVHLQNHLERVTAAREIERFLDAVEAQSGADERA